MAPDIAPVNEPVPEVPGSDSDSDSGSGSGLQATTDMEKA